MTTHIRRLAPIICASALAFAACGSDGSTSTADTKAAATASTATTETTQSTATTAHSTAKCSMPELVILLAFLRVTQHIICLRKLFKLFLRGFIARVFIRMILHRKFSISLLYF